MFRWGGLGGQLRTMLFHQAVLREIIIFENLFLTDVSFIAYSVKFCRLFWEILWEVKKPLKPHPSLMAFFTFVPLYMCMCLCFCLCFNIILSGWLLVLCSSPPEELILACATEPDLPELFSLQCKANFEYRKKFPKGNNQRLLLSFYRPPLIQNIHMHEKSNTNAKHRQIQK